MIEFDHISTNGIRLHTALSGPETGEGVILLHGFPDAWFGWKPQIEALADAGFRVIAPDQRGYNMSDKPRGVANYQMNHLVNDILGLADALGYDRFYLGGHDFGAIVSWNLAMHHPERVKRLVIANVPHPAAMKKYLRTHLSQLIKSWYAFFFQLPKLPEWTVKVNKWHFLMSAMPAGLKPDESDRYRKAWAQPGAMTGMINWYRALRKSSTTALISPIVTVPTLMLWGKQDPHISYQMAPQSIEFCEAGKLVMFEEASHWVLYDEPQATSSLIVQHFSNER